MPHCHFSRPVCKPSASITLYAHGFYYDPMRFSTVLSDLAHYDIFRNLGSPTLMVHFMHLTLIPYSFFMVQYTDASITHNISLHS